MSFAGYGLLLLSYWLPVGGVAPVIQQPLSPFVGELQGCLQLCPDTIKHHCHLTYPLVAFVLLKCCFILSYILFCSLLSIATLWSNVKFWHIIIHTMSFTASIISPSNWCSSSSLFFNSALSASPRPILTLVSWISFHFFLHLTSFETCRDAYLGYHYHFYDTEMLLQRFTRLISILLHSGKEQTESWVSSNNSLSLLPLMD